jgi:Ca2+/Na+ antiporter
VSLGYWIIPGILYWLGKALWYGGGFGAFLGVLFLILGIGIGLVAFFLFPMALAFFSRENESFAAAFRWSGMVEKIWMVQRDYFAGWVATLVFFLVLVFVRAYFLYLGWILYALGVFYLSLVAADFFGRVCRESMEVRR